MGRRSALEPMKEQILEWIRQGRTNAWMAAKLETEYSVKRTPQQIGTFAKRLLAPTLSKVSEAAKVQLDTFEKIAIEALSKYASLCAKDEATMTLGERNYFRTVGEWFDRIARLRGLYAPQNLTQVAVGVQVHQGDELREWAKQVLQG